MPEENLALLKVVLSTVVIAQGTVPSVRMRINLCQAPVAWWALSFRLQLAGLFFVWTCGSSHLCTFCAFCSVHCY